MEFLKFLEQFKQIQTTISLVAFLIAAVLGYLYYFNNSKLKFIGSIISKSGTETKANLARDLLQVFPSHKIPQLTEKHGHGLLKIELQHKADAFRLHMKVIIIGMTLLFILILALIGKSFFDFKETYGNKSPIIQGDGNKVIITDTAKKGG